MTTLAHVGGVPIEETLGSLGPALLVGLGVAWGNLRARLRRARSRPSGGPLSPRARRGARYGSHTPDPNAAAGRGVHAQQAGTRHG